MEALFNDGAIADDLFVKLRSYYENAAYNEMAKQAETDPHYDWGDGLNALIISDRALGRALGLYVYLSKICSFKNVQFCADIESIRDRLDNIIPDIIVYVGMQNNPVNYQAIPLARKMNSRVLIVMSAFLDGEVKYDCVNNGIRYAFSSAENVRDGLLYLREAFEDNRKCNA